MNALKTHKELVDMDSLSLFLEARLPAKFKMPNMDKFDGTTCPKTHFRMYMGALQPFGLGDELLAQLFQQSLTGAALRWFVGLDKTKIKTWEMSAMPSTVNIITTWTWMLPGESWKLLVMRKKSPLPNSLPDGGRRQLR